MTKPWDRLQDKKEGSKSYAAFCVYRDMGSERTYEAVAKTCKKSVSHISKLGLKYDWVGRATRYDDHLLAKDQKKFEAKLAKFREEVTTEAIEIRKRSAEFMKDDNPSPRSTTDRWVAATDVVLKVNGLDKPQKTEHSGEIKVIISKVQP